MAGGERVLRREEPIGEIHAGEALPGGRRVLREERGEGGLHFLGGVHPIAAREEVRLRDFLRRQGLGDHRVGVTGVGGEHVGAGFLVGGRELVVRRVGEEESGLDLRVGGVVRVESGCQRGAEGGVLTGNGICEGAGAEAEFPDVRGRKGERERGVPGGGNGLLQVIVGVVGKAGGVGWFLENRGGGLPGSLKLRCLIAVAVSCGGAAVGLLVRET